MPEETGEKQKSLGSPFSTPSSRPWLVDSSTFPLSRSSINPFPMTIFVFVRHRFGERFLTPTSLIYGMSLLGVYAVAMRLVAGGGWFDLASPVPLISWLTWFSFSVLFLVFASLHLFAAIRRRKMLPDEFSFSDGQPREGIFLFMPFLRNVWEYELYFEPGMCLGLGILLLYFHNWFGGYFLLSSISMYIVAAKKYALRRELELNVMDSQMEAKSQPRFEDELGGSPTSPIRSIGDSPNRGKI